MWFYRAVDNTLHALMESEGLLPFSRNLPFIYISQPFESSLHLHISFL
jgi:hypothetical protein